MAQTDNVTITGSNSGNDAVTAYFTVGQNGNFSYNTGNATQLGTAAAPTQNGFAINFTLDQNQTAQFTGGQARIFILNGAQNNQTIFNNNGVLSNSGNGGGFTNPAINQVLVNVPVPVQPAPVPVICYVTGTRIRVLDGLTVREVPVERLRVGDLALTASGKPRPIRWIGSRSYAGLSAPKHDRPVRIRAGAIALSVPSRDLCVSPDHALMVDGLFVAAGHLVNGKTITRGEAMADLTYWHVELDSHDLLMAENTPAESFLAVPGARATFDGEGADTATAPVAYAPRIERTDPRLGPLRARLIARAGLSDAPAQFGAVRAWLDVCDGARVAGWAQDDAHPGAPVCLDILVDGEIVAMALAQDHRADLAAAGMGDGRHGFDIELDAPLTPGIAHTVEIRRSVDGLRVAAMAVDAAGAWTAHLAA